MAPTAMVRRLLIIEKIQGISIDGLPAPDIIDSIDSWELASDLSDVPRPDICDDCWIGKIRMMQQSPYSAYNTPWETMLNYSISGKSIPPHHGKN